MVNILAYVVIGIAALIVMNALSRSTSEFRNSGVQTLALLVGVLAWPCFALAILALFKEDGLFGVGAGSWALYGVAALAGSILLGRVVRALR